MAESPNVPTEYPDGDHGDSPLTAADPPWDPLAAPHLGAQSPLIQASDDDDQDNYDDGLSKHLPDGLAYNPALHPPKRDLPVPDRIPGEPVLDGDKHWTLKKHLAELCGTHGTARFPGSQPVSFDLESLQLLEQEDFWVCEKSDGVRVLVLIVATGFGQEVYLIDRKDAIHQCYWLTFPHQDGPEFNHSNTVLDGEFVIDVDPNTGQHIPRLLVFDLLVLDSENIMSKPLQKRYGRLQAYVVEPYKKYQRTLPPDVIANQPFEVVCKKQELSYGIEAVFRDHVPKLLHGNDGLIFTSAEAPYTPGTDPKILKWKPPSENSIDFVLQLKFPPKRDNEREPDFYAKPVFMLLMNHGHEGSHYYDTMEVDDETWEAWKRSGEQYDDRVVEVVWDRTRETWRLLRFRDDKFEGNYKTVVSSIIRSIEHGVEAELLVAHAGRIKKAWKARQARREGGGAGAGAGAGGGLAQGLPPGHGQGQGQGHGYGQGAAPPPPVHGAGGYGGGGGGGGGLLRR
ncbi:mRNA capping enzyme, catalytic domain-containing protein [Rhodotorula diobovata]|uniref:mRNA guanylyltransferase n=1 Tax=Rhodotorula diobovata TaxID=5288 RepID=A0A5C5G5Y1_9BASI|nr:mRNA capping enzyme, catalytic domain-containing protein [Rhodotorula diobovata]